MPHATFQHGPCTSTSRAHTATWGRAVRPLLRTKSASYVRSSTRFGSPTPVCCSLPVSCTQVTVLRTKPLRCCACRLATNVSAVFEVQGSVESLRKVVFVGPLSRGLITFRSLNSVHTKDQLSVGHSRQTSSKILAAVSADETTDLKQIFKDALSTSPTQTGSPTPSTSASTASEGPDSQHSQYCQFVSETCAVYIRQALHCLD